VISINSPGSSRDFLKSYLQQHPLADERFADQLNNVPVRDITRSEIAVGKLLRIYRAQHRVEFGGLTIGSSALINALAALDAKMKLTARGFRTPQGGLHLYTGPDEAFVGLVLLPPPAGFIGNNAWASFTNFIKRIRANGQIPATINRLLKTHEPCEALRDMCHWILRQPEQYSSPISMQTHAGEVCRIYTIRQQIATKHGRTIPGNQAFIKRLAQIPASRKVGAYSYHSRNNFAIAVWLDETSAYLGITRLIPSYYELPHDFVALQLAVG
jgi:hypothetical protein